MRSSCLLNGNWEDFDNREKIPVSNPFNLELITQVPKCSKEDFGRAIESAHMAFNGWRSLAALDRSKCLMRISEIMRAKSNELAELLTREQGKILREARSEIEYGASYFEWFSQEARRINGDILQSPVMGREILVKKVPVGVVAIITPWNFPLAMIARKLAAALAAGCSAVVRPSSMTPLSALALAEIILESGVPGGVVNILTGDAKEAAAALTQSPLVKKISFTGSTSVGRELMAASAATLKRVTLELGGNAPFLVFDDCDIAAAVDAAIKIKFRNSGQTCICVNRFLVHESVHAKFAEALVKRCAMLKAGDGMDPASDVGPLISEDAFRKVDALKADALKNGARILFEGKSQPSKRLYAPVVIDGVRSDMRIWREEIFGPLAGIRKFADDQEAIDLANDTEYGLAAYAFTRDIGRIRRLREELEFGMLGINADSISYAEMPFGGIKDSGFGREGSKYGLDDYLMLKSSVIQA